MTPQTLKGRCAVVTGGAGGAGHAVAARLLEAGAVVCLWDIDQRRLVKSASELSALGRTIQAEVDVADAVSVAAAFGATVKALGRIDILVNTVPAGVLPCSRLALAHMAERGSGRIVNVGAAGAAGSPAAGAMADGVMAGGVMVIDVAAGADAGEILSAVVR